MRTAYIYRYYIYSATQQKSRFFYKAVYTLLFINNLQKTSKRHLKTLFFGWTAIVHKRHINTYVLMTRVLVVTYEVFARAPTLYSHLLRVYWFRVCAYAKYTSSWACAVSINVINSNSRSTFHGWTRRFLPDKARTATYSQCQMRDWFINILQCLCAIFGS